MACADYFTALNDLFLSCQALYLPAFIFNFGPSVQQQGHKKYFVCVCVCIRFACFWAGLAQNERIGLPKLGAQNAKVFGCQGGGWGVRVCWGKG